MYGFVGKTEKILHTNSADLRYYLFTHNHFEVHYNGNNIIQVTMTTDATQAIDVSEDVLPDNSGTPSCRVHVLGAMARDPHGVRKALGSLRCAISQPHQSRGAPSMH